MANTRTTYQLYSKEIEEIIHNHGLPDEISTEAQLWDLIIKKATYSSPKLLFPLIYEIYGKQYPKDSIVVPLSTEYSVERSDTKEISTIKADLTFSVNESDIYHFECEITYDGQITIRMLEYDLHAALNFRTDTKKSGKSICACSFRFFRFAFAVIYLLITNSSQQRLPKSRKPSKKN